MVDRYAKFVTENLAFAAFRIELGREDGNLWGRTYYRVKY